MMGGRTLMRNKKSVNVFDRLKESYRECRSLDIALNSLYYSPSNIVNRLHPSQDVYAGYKHRHLNKLVELDLAVKTYNGRIMLNEKGRTKFLEGGFTLELLFNIGKIGVKFFTALLIMAATIVGIVWTIFELCEPGFLPRYQIKEAPTGIICPLLGS